MVATSVAPAAAVGAEILAQGGNAVDAAVAMGLAAGVAHQFSSGIGGGGFVVGRLANGEAFALDAREVAPAAAGPDMYLDENGRLARQRSRYGGLAVAVPGLVQGLEEVHARHGRLLMSRVAPDSFTLPGRSLRRVTFTREDGAVVGFELEAYSWSATAFFAKR